MASWVPHYRVVSLLRNAFKTLAVQITTFIVVTRQITRVPKARVLIWSVTWQYLLHGNTCYMASILGQCMPS